MKSRGIITTYFSDQEVQERQQLQEFLQRHLIVSILQMANRATHVQTVKQLTSKIH